MIKRTISASNPRTILYPVTLTATLIGIVVSYFIVVRMEPFFGIEPSPIATALVMAGFWAMLIVANYRRMWLPLKQVALDDRFLYVSDYGDPHELAIPVTEIAQITQRRGRTLRPVTVHLRSPTPFGESIKFQPKSEVGWAFKESRIVDELRTLAHR